MCLIPGYGLGLFVGSLAVHVLVWRVHRPATYRTWLPILATIFGPLAVGVAWAAVPTGTERAAVLLLHFSLSGAYIIGYTLISAFSPSIELLKLLDRAPDGMPFDELRLPFLAGELTGDRIENLERARLVRAHDGRLTLGPRGRRMTAIALWYRHAVGLPDGSGG